MKSLLKFNGINFPSKVGITSFTVSTPETTFETYDIPTRVGMGLYRRKFGTRAVQFSCVLLGDTISENNKILQNLYNWCYSDEPAPMIIPGMSSSHINVECETYPPADIGKTGSEFQIAFKAQNPCFFDNIISTADVGDSFTVGGMIPTYPTITFTPTTAVTSPKWTFDNNGYVLINRTIAAGKTVIIDCENDEVTVDGVSVNASVTINSTICQALAPGAHTITGTSGAGGVVSWRNAALWGV